MSGPVGVGVIGAGVISTQYLETMVQFPDIEVRYIADLDLDRAAAQAAAYGVAASGSVDELLARDDIEIVVNLTIPAVHVEVAMRSLAAGKHVWSEKPFALDRESGRQLLDTAAHLGLRAATAPDTVLGGGIQSGLRGIESGLIGSPTTAFAAFQTPGPESWHPNPEFLFQAGGGPLFDMGPYYLTALALVFGPARRVAATASAARPTRVIGSGPRAGTEFAVDVPTTVSGLIEYENGGSAQVVFSFDSPIQRVGVIEVTGTLAAIALPDPNRFDGDSSLWSFVDEEPRAHAATGAMHGRGLGVVELARAIRAGRPERASGELAFHVLDILCSLTDAADSRQWVDVRSSFERPAPLDEAWDPTVATL